jgi:dTDP-4-dehydrorhamnose reductase
MLGSMVMRILKDNPGIEVFGTSRKGEPPYFPFDPTFDSLALLFEQYNPDFIVNCIGTIKPQIIESSKVSVENAIRVNSIFPLQLAAAVDERPIRVIQIATDCVFSGIQSPYRENSSHDATDIYGKTKSLGEVRSTKFMHLRVSIVGPEVGTQRSLLEWFLSRRVNETLKGFVNHSWNGISTVAFAKIVEGIITTNSFRDGVYHLVPEDQVSKFELLNIFSRAFSRADLTIEPFEAPSEVNRILATNHMDLNEDLWSKSSYGRKLSISEMVSEMANYKTSDL